MNTALFYRRIICLGVSYNKEHKKYTVSILDNLTWQSLVYYFNVDIIGETGWWCNDSKSSYFILLFYRYIGYRDKRNKTYVLFILFFKCLENIIYKLIKLRMLFIHQYPLSFKGEEVLALFLNFGYGKEL